MTATVYYTCNCIHCGRVVQGVTHEHAFTPVCDQCRATRNPEPFEEARKLGQVNVTGPGESYQTPTEHCAAALERIAAALEELTPSETVRFTEAYFAGRERKP